VHKYLADAIEELGVQDRTVAISPVGCSVFLYYYLDVGNTQAAHGRAPAVALGHKLANPDSIVVSYQGDGDLASIGLAEILHAAQLGLPLTVIFVNNAIYGMTGGQMAPTTLTGQKTATSPLGRGRLEGAPLRVAELVAQIDGAVYVERVALFDAKQRVKAGKAIRRALQTQVDNLGFAFVEVLAECPLHLGLTPPEAEAWVERHMLPVFPLGVKIASGDRAQRGGAREGGSGGEREGHRGERLRSARAIPPDMKDAAAQPWPAWPKPSFDPRTVLGAVGAGGEVAPRFAPGFPATGFGEDIGLKLAGAGGDGAQTAAMLVARAAINEGFDATHIPSYGPESRGGTSYADVRIAADEVLSPAVSQPHALVAFNAPSLAKFGPSVAKGGVVVYDRSVVASPASWPGVHVAGIPCSQAAQDLGDVRVKNVVALGALNALMHLFPDETYLAAIRQALAGKPALAPLNERAFARGVELAGARAGIRSTS
jgi:2-oxoisovalerate ferredoxin oxidoreductase beta subunit